MKYLLLIYGNEAAEAKKSEAEMGKVLAEYKAYTEEVARSGKLVGGEALQPTGTATTVRVRGGKMVTTDGPFADTKEQLGGYYMVDCANLDEAIGWACKIPGAKEGCVEVRPIWEIPGA
ncbi:MAG: YciI family protein [Planctomycetota bacterium]